MSVQLSPKEGPDQHSADGSAWHAVPIGLVLNRLPSGVDGLSEADAAKRLTMYVAIACPLVLPRARCADFSSSSTTS